MPSHLTRFSRLVLLLIVVFSIPSWVLAQESSQEIAKALQPFVDRQTLAGAVVVVADKEKILDLETVGFSDIETKKMMAPETVFWIASQSKPITAVGLMMLLDDGKIGLDDPIEKYLPEFRGLWLTTEETKGVRTQKHPKRSVTVRDILCHTSGMPFSSALEAPTLDGLTLKDAVRSYAITPLKYEPGTKYEYSNAGINTAGRIIEVVSEMSYEDFMQKRLFDPLGMKDTTFWPNEEQVGRLAKPYRPGENKTGLIATKIGQLQYPLSDRRRQPMPAGGLFSTARDVTRFCQMMLNGGSFEGKVYLKEETVKQMATRQTAPELPTSYGLGFSTGGGNFGHGGALATNMNIDTNRGLVFVWLVQHAGYPGDGNNAQGVARRIAEERFGKK